MKIGHLRDLGVPCSFPRLARKCRISFIRHCPAIGAGHFSPIGALILFLSGIIRQSEQRFSRLGA